MTFSARELAVHCARIVDEKGGDDVLVLQLPSSAHSFDFAVLVTAKSDRLTNALVEEVWHFCKRHHVPRMPVEGETGWMLIDCYDVVVHALSTEKREFYQLDTLWETTRKVDWAKEAKALGDPDRPDRPAATAPSAARAKPKRASRAHGKAPAEQVELAEASAEAARLDKVAKTRSAVRKSANTPRRALAKDTPSKPKAKRPAATKRPAAGTSRTRRPREE